VALRRPRQIIEEISVRKILNGAGEVGHIDGSALRLLRAIQ
jgi:hypothetical protein